MQAATARRHVSWEASSLPVVPSQHREARIGPTLAEMTAKPHENPWEISELRWLLGGFMTH